MKLNSIKFLNFRRFRKETLNLEDSFNTIFGLNGAGKTSILDAIGFAFFGNSSKDFKRGASSDDMISHFVRDEEGKSEYPSKIELNFEVSAGIYKIVRVINKGLKKHESDFIEEKEDSLFGPNNLIIVGGGEVSNYVEKNLLGIDRDIFLRSVFAKQKDLVVLAGNEKDRKSIINSILGIDIIEEIANTINEDFKDKQRDIKLKKQEIDNFKEEEFKENLKTLFDSKKNLDEKKKLIFNDIEKLKKDYESLSKNYKEELEKKDKNILFLNKKELFLSKEINFLKQKKDYEKTLESLREKEKELLENFKIFLEEKETYDKIKEMEKKEILFLQKQNLEKTKFLEEKELEDILKNLKILYSQNGLIGENNSIEIEEKNKSFDKEKQTLRENITKISNEIRAIENNLKIIKEEGIGLREELNNIKSLSFDASCPTCKRKLGEQYTFLVSSYEKMIDEKLKNYKEIDVNLKGKQTNLEIFIKKENVLQKEIQDFLITTKNISELLSKKQNKDQNLSKIISDLEILGDLKIDSEINKKIKSDFEILKDKRAKLRSIEGEIKQIPLLIEKNLEIENDLKNIKINLFEIEKTLKEINFDEEKFEQIKIRFEDFSKIYIEKQDVLNNLTKEVSVFEKDINSINEKILNFEEQKKSLLSINEELYLLQTKRDILKNYSVYLFNYLKPKIEAIASEYFSSMTDFKYSRIFIDEKYNILIDGKSLDLYSGGEQDLANLCIRLSLGQNISLTNTGNHINFLILDEVLGSQDNIRQINILTALKKLEHKYSQVLLISHSEGVKDFSTKLIEVKQKTKEESEIIEL